MMKMRYNENTGLYESHDCNRLTGEGNFDIFTKVGSEVAKEAAKKKKKKKKKKKTSVLCGYFCLFIIKTSKNFKMVIQFTIFCIKF